MTLPQYQRKGYGRLLIDFSTWISLLTSLHWRRHFVICLVYCVISQSCSPSSWQIYTWNSLCYSKILIVCAMNLIMCDWWMHRMYQCCVLVFDSMMTWHTIRLILLLAFVFVFVFFVHRICLMCLLTFGCTFYALYLSVLDHFDCTCMLTFCVESYEWMKRLLLSVGANGSIKNKTNTRLKVKNEHCNYVKLVNHWVRFLSNIRSIRGIWSTLNRSFSNPSKTFRVLNQIQICSGIRETSDFTVRFL